MQLSKKGNVGGIQSQTLAVILGVIGVVILVAVAPELWTVLDDALADIGTADIPFISSLSGVLGLIFGVVIFLGALYGMFKLFQKRR
jgi:phage-related minor tail protein